MLKDKLLYLKSYYGWDKIQQWNDWIEQKLWKEHVSSIIEV